MPKQKRYRSEAQIIKPKPAPNPSLHDITSAVPDESIVR